MSFTPPNVLFYSKQCGHCQKFAETLYKLPEIHKSFVEISIDAKNIRLPNFLTHVPTIVVFDPRGERSIHIGPKAFQWLNQFFETPEKKQELQDYDAGMMSSSLSDSYALLEDKGDSGRGSFVTMDNWESQSKINLVSEEAFKGHKQGSVDGSDMERYKQERDKALQGGGSGGGGQQSLQPQKTIDFTKLYEQDNSQHKVTLEDVKRFQQNTKSRRQPPPRRAPNFQSQNFNNNSRGGNELDQRMEHFKSQRDRDMGGRRPPMGQFGGGGRGRGRGGRQMPSNFRTL